MVIANIMTCLCSARFGPCTNTDSYSVCQLEGLCPITPGIKAGTMEVLLEHTEDLGSRSKRSLDIFPNGGSYVHSAYGSMFRFPVSYE